MTRSIPSITVCVPATTANLGPGFDTLGIALELYNHVRLSPNGSSAMRLVSAIDDANRSGAGAMIDEAADRFFKHSSTSPFGCDVSLTGDVPAARGLGSSVTVRLGVVAGLNALSGAKLTRPRLLDLVTALEGHPDNAAPATFGGFTVAGRLEDGVRCIAFPVPAAARFVALIPRFEVKTSEARILVPDSLSRVDTVHNLNRAALITAAFASGNLEALRGLFEDRIHQPYRRKLIPQLNAVIRAGEGAGAIGGWLSGSGSTIVCLSLRNPREVAEAMQLELPGSDIHILRADARGVQVCGQAADAS
jgi:homoserine kinase